MIKLNLLPEKVRAGETLKLIILAGVAVYVLGLLLLGWRWMAANAKVNAVKAEAAAIQAKLDAPELREAVEAVDRFTKDQKEVKDKASVVNILRKRQVGLLRLLDQLPDWMLGGQVWLQSLEVSPEKNDRKVTIQGRAVSASAFALFFTNLEAQPIVTKMTLVAPPRLLNELGQKVHSFTVSFILEELP
jgi:Tfp pilus assembly protein PilN